MGEGEVAALRRWWHAGGRAALELAGARLVGVVRVGAGGRRGDGEGGGGGRGEALADDEEAVMTLYSGRGRGLELHTMPLNRPSQEERRPRGWLDGEMVFPINPSLPSGHLPTRWEGHPRSPHQEHTDMHRVGHLQPRPPAPPHPSMCPPRAVPLTCITCNSSPGPPSAAAPACDDDTRWWWVRDLANCSSTRCCRWPDSATSSCIMEEGGGRHLALGRAYGNYKPCHGCATFHTYPHLVPERAPGQHCDGRLQRARRLDPAIPA